MGSYNLSNQHHIDSLGSTGLKGSKSHGLTGTKTTDKSPNSDTNYNAMNVKIKPNNEQ